MSDIRDVAAVIRRATMSRGDGQTVTDLLKSWGVDEEDLREVLLADTARYIEGEGGSNPMGLLLPDDLAAFGLHMFCVGFSYGRETITV